MFTKISLKAQFLLLGMYLQERCGTSMPGELVELKKAKYIDKDYNLTSKGIAFIYAKNSVGINFKTLVAKNSSNANKALAYEIVNYFSKTEAGQVFIGNLIWDEVEVTVDADQDEWSGLEDYDESLNDGRPEPIFNDTDDDGKLIITRVRLGN